MSSNGTRKTQRGSGGLVYSTQVGRTCPVCRKSIMSCVCGSKRSGSVDGGIVNEQIVNDGIVRLHRETKGRKGKGVTLIQGLRLSEIEMAALTRTLKSQCGVGGAIKSGVIELQTSDRQKVKLLLETAGFSVKVAGG